LDFTEFLTLPHFLMVRRRNSMETAPPLFQSEAK